jgi:FlaG/FlaF family flagellin (archaellin)
MKIKLLLALVLAAALVTPAFGKTFKVPDEKPTASITVPDSWKSKEIDKGIEAQSSDSEVYFAIEATDAKGMEKTIDEAIEYLKGQGVTVDQSTMKQSEGSINGMKGWDITWNGTDKEGDAIVSLTILAVSDKDALIITYWAAPEGTKKYAKELGEILNIIKKV